MKVGWANLLTLSRLLLLVPSVYFVLAADWRLAVAVYVVAVATDVADGAVARALQQATPFGGLLDHSVDAMFVGGTLAALASVGHVNQILPLLVIASFVQYMLDSKALTGQALRASILGRYNGIGYFALVGAALGCAALGIDGSLIIANAAWLLVATTLMSMIDRGLAYQKVRGSP